MTAGGRAGDLLRRVVVPRLHTLPGMRAKVVDSTTPPLSRSCLVHKTPAGNRLAGTLCPNMPTADGRRLDAVLGDGFALVTAQAPEVADRLLAERLGTRVCVAEPGSELAKWLRRGRAEAAIIRPDRAVLRAGRDVSALCQALRSPAQ